MKQIVNWMELLRWFVLPYVLKNKEANTVEMDVNVWGVNNKGEVDVYSRHLIFRKVLRLCASNEFDVLISDIDWNHHRSIILAGNKQELEAFSRTVRNGKYYQLPDFGTFRLYHGKYEML